MAVGEVFPVGDGVVADDADVQRAAAGITFLVVGPMGWELLNLAETLMNQPLNGLFEAGEHIKRLVVDEQALGHASARPSRFSAFQADPACVIGVVELGRQLFEGAVLTLMAQRHEKSLKAPDLIVRPCGNFASERLK